MEFLKERLSQKSLLMGKEGSECWKGKKIKAEESREKQDPKQFWELKEFLGQRSDFC